MSLTLTLILSLIQTQAKEKAKQIKKAAKKVYKKAKKAIKRAAKKLVEKAKQLKDHVVNKISSFARKHILPKAMKILIKLCPAKFRSIMKAMLPPLFKGDWRKAVVKGLTSPGALNYIPKQFHPLVKFAAPDLVYGKYKKLLATIISNMRGYVLEPLFAKFKVMMLTADCAMKNVLLPIVDADYHIAIKGAYKNAKGEVVAGGIRDAEAGPGCAANANMDSNWQGPLRFVITRKLISTGEVVCQFTHSSDAFVCNGGNSNCCSSWAHSSPRFTESTFDPKKQVTGHDCKAWYLGALAATQALIGFATSSTVNNHMKYCNKDDCDRGEYCTQKACDENSMGVKNDKCKWIKNEVRWTTRRRLLIERSGYCAGSVGKGVNKVVDADSPPGPRADDDPYKLKP